MPRILVLEPYYGGSHRAVLDGLLERLCRDFDWHADVLTMPARKWKWRMRGAAIVMAEQARELRDRHAAASAVDPSGSPWDLVYASTFVNLAEFVALAGDAVTHTDGRRVPAAVYFHENQLLYPNRHEAEWDLQFPLTNVVSALTADLCLFNTQWNLDGFLAEIPGFLKRFPDHLPRGVAERISAHSEVLAPPFDPSPFDAALGGSGAASVISAPRGARPRIVWPHRWEHDKNPDEFFSAVTALAREGLVFEVAVAGQVFDDRPDVFQQAEDALGDRLVHLGTPEGLAAYAELLTSSDIAVSTAHNEFFGIAMIEAAYAGCYPLVPDRLAYPDIYPDEYRYASPDDLVARLRSLVLERPAPGCAREVAERFTFDRLVPGYARAFAEACAERNLGR